MAESLSVAGIMVYSTTSDLSLCLALLMVWFWGANTPRMIFHIMNLSVLAQLDTAGVITENGASVEEMPP